VAAFVGIRSAGDGERDEHANVDMTAGMKYDQLERINSQAGTRLVKTIERIRWRLWHGQIRRALDLIAETVTIAAPTADDIPPTVAAVRKVTRLLGDLETYVSGQSDIIIDYATPHRREEPISTVITESTVQWLLHRRMSAQ
jgi:hypothetical protein